MDVLLIPSDFLPLPFPCLAWDQFHATCSGFPQKKEWKNNVHNFPIYGRYFLLPVLAKNAMMCVDKT